MNDSLTLWPGDDNRAETFHRPSAQRLFCRVNAMGQGFEVDHFDAGAGWAGWQSWNVGSVLHWHPFKLHLNVTQRAGLHITAEWRDVDGDMRYGSNHKVREAGVFVLNPSGVMGLGERWADAVRDPGEASIIHRFLVSRFGMSGGLRQFDAMASDPRIVVVDSASARS